MAETTVKASEATPGTDLGTRRRGFAPELRVALVFALAVLAAVAYCLLFLRGSFEFAIERRLTMVGAILVAAFTQGVATTMFQTVTQNRILTPSIMGFESIHTLLQTLLVVVFGGSVLAATDGLPKLITQTLLMVAFATFLFRWLFSGRFADLHVLLLVGVAIGMAFDSLAVFGQRVLSPAEYDVLSVRLFGRLSTVDAEQLPLAAGVCLVVGLVVWRRRARLDVLHLGRDVATNLGISYQRELTVMLVAVSLLVAFSTALVGPMTFFGFLVTLLARQLAGTHRHAVLLPMAFGLGALVLLVGQFTLEHVFYASGQLTVVVELLGGIVFLTILLRRGTL
ncbi:iron chelate uptake ABC transporter family permease subunit [Kineococcus sp. SYSU DK003]|uniref:iron chelate uptake ABC transporter family permease subunit n=1 Tax=Kineococcus sp. SYSU DK003 TaxID=3383124 RepID=UPI003D7CFF67